MRRSLQERADAEVPTARVLEDLYGVRMPGLSHGTSVKVSCPHAFEHADGGVDKNCRWYGEHLHCFAMHGRLTSTRLAAMRWDLPTHRAARRLLERYDLLRPRPWRERYAEVVRQREAVPGAGDTAYAAEALLATLARRVPGWEQAQYRPDVLAVLERVLDGLDVLLAREGSDASADTRRWYGWAVRTVEAHVTRGEDGR